MTGRGSWRADMSRAYRVLVLVPAILLIANFGLTLVALAGGGPRPTPPCLPGDWGC